MHKFQLARAKELVHRYIEKYTTGQEFFGKTVHFIAQIRTIQLKFGRQIARRRYKRMVLRDYWKMVCDRFTKLKLRNQFAEVKRYNAANVDQISEKIRDGLLSTAILIQEEKYVENLRKFNRHIKTTPDARMRVCSRILKAYTDDFVLNHRTYEHDIDIIKAQIDQCLPLIDPMKEAAEKKAQAKQKKKGAVPEKVASPDTIAQEYKAKVARKKAAEAAEVARGQDEA